MPNTESPNERRQPSAPQDLTTAQNAVMTIKLLVGVGLLIVLFWLVDRAIS